MIQYFKDLIKNSILLKVFLGVLTISFGIWGVGDFMKPGMDPSIAVTVAHTDIPTDDVQKRFNRELDRFKQSLKGQSGPELDAAKQTILNSVVQTVTEEVTLDAAAADLGLVVSQDALRARIREEPAFADEKGNFSQFTYTQRLAAANLTEKAFLKDFTSQIRQEAILSPLLTNAVAPEMLMGNLLSYRVESRSADTLLITADTIPVQRTPSEADLKKIYDDNIATFTAPEYRKVTALVIRSDQMVTPDAISDEQAKSYYDENIDRYRTAETRHVSQLVFDTKENAEAARALMAPGDHIEAIATKAKLSPPVDLGALKRTDSLVKTIGAAYDLPVGEVSQPVESELGWHLFEVKSVQPESVRDFAAVQGEIRKTMAEDKGTDALYDASVAVEDGIAGGTPFDDLAQRVNGRVLRVDALDKDGKDPRGLDPAGIIDNANFAQTVFATPVGSESKLIEIPKGYYVIHVESSTPPAPRPFDTVRKDVTSLWEKQAQAAIARDMAAKLAGDVGPTTSLATLAAKDRWLSYAPLGPITRFGQGVAKDHLVDTKRIGPELLEKLFRAKVGDVIFAPAAGGMVVARLKEIVAPTDNAEFKQSQAQTYDGVKQGIATDLAIEINKAFADRYPAIVNTPAIQQLVTTAR